MDVDYLIVGQGLAGSLLAWRLLQHGQRVLVVDNGNPHSATRVAAGLVNPVTGQRLVKQAQAESLLAAARTLYGALAEQFGQDFFHHKPLLRVIQSPKERVGWEKRRADPAYAEFLGECFQAGKSGANIHDPLGSFEQRQTGYLATRPLLDSLRAYFQSRGSYRRAMLDPQRLVPGENGVEWDDVRARKIIFCEGYRSINNPWFAWLPAQPAKGEILTLRLDGEPPPQIIKGKCWLLPMADGRCKLGATYSWAPIDEQPTTQAQQWLLEQLSTLMDPAPGYRDLEAAAGVRPGTRDKLPWLGLHPAHPQLGIMNGFGSKGSMLVPYYSECMVRFLLEGAELPPEADIQRHQDLLHATP